MQFRIISQLQKDFQAHLENQQQLFGYCKQSLHEMKGKQQGTSSKSQQNIQ